MKKITRTITFTVANYSKLVKVDGEWKEEKSFSEVPEKLTDYEMIKKIEECGVIVVKESISITHEDRKIEMDLGTFVTHGKQVKEE